MPKLQNPVIVIPGITGTSLHDDYPLKTRDLWTMILNKEYRRLALHPDDLRYETREPAHVYPGRLFSIYDDFIEALRHDLTEQADRPTPVFAFPYDWRRKLQSTAPELDEFVEEVIARTKLLRHYDGYDKVNKVDLVGHSMGGLLICEYLHQFGGKKRVGRVATMGTPYLGSIEAVVKLATGMGNLSGSKPSAREREAARTIPAIYQLLPSFDEAAVAPDGGAVDLFKPRNWQRNILESLAEYIRLNSVKHHRPKKVREKRAAEILKNLLDAAREEHETVRRLHLAAGGLEPGDWLTIIGIGEKTRLQITVTGLPNRPRFSISDDQYRERWEKDKSSRETGDGTVPLAGALPPFLRQSEPICVCPDDFSMFEVADKMLLGLAGFHALLPNLNLVQRLVLKHLRPMFRGEVWGRRVPGAETWNPPIPRLKERDKPK